VLRALRFVPEGKQHLKPVKLRRQVAIDPTTDDFFRQAIVERRKVKQGLSPYDALSQGERDRLQKFLKILVNATAYGIYMQMDRQDGTTARVQAHGLTLVERTIDGPEKLGPYCFPPLATLITSAARLMLELAASEVHQRGGHHALMDTDSLAIVATELGATRPQMVFYPLSGPG
jgi:DNA polymerase elongation subunit (family B)